MHKALSTSLLMSWLLLSAGCQSVPPAQLEVVQCPPVPKAPAWMMEPESEQSYTQRLLQVLSE